MAEDFIERLKRECYARREVLKAEVYPHLVEIDAIERVLIEFGEQFDHWGRLAPPRRLTQWGPDAEAPEPEPLYPPEPGPPAAEEPPPEEPKEPAEQPKLLSIKLSADLLDKVWLRLRTYPAGAHANQLAESGDLAAKSTVGIVLRQLEAAGRVTSEMAHRPIRRGNSSQLRTVRIYRIVSPQAKNGAPPDPTSRPRQTPPEVEAVARAPKHRGTPPTGNYPLPTDNQLKKMVRKAVQRGWEAEYSGKGGHTIRCHDPQNPAWQIYVPREQPGYHVVNRVISEFRKAGIK